MDQGWLKWLEGIFGFDAGDSQGSAEVLLTREPQSWGIFLLIALVVAVIYGVLWLYRREGATCPPRVRIALGIIRLAVVLVLIAIFLGPSVQFTQRDVAPYTVIVARDVSQSIATRDRYFDDATAGAVAQALGSDADSVRAERPQRAALIDKVIARSELLQKLTSRGKIRVVDFSDRVSLITTAAAESEKKPSSAGDKNGEAKTDPKDKPNSALVLPAVKPVGQRTDLAMLIRKALDSGPTSAIVIFTDGQHTPVGENPDNADVREAATEAASRGVKLIFVGVGDPARPRNLRVTDVYAHPRIAPDEKFEVLSKVRVEGFDLDLDQSGKPISRPQETMKVELVEMKDNKQVAVLQTIDKPIPQTAHEEVSVRFTVPPRTTGEYAFTVRVKPVPNELDAEDNEFRPPVTVSVLKKKKRLLMVAGAPTWEYRMMNQLLSRDKTLLVSTWLQTLEQGRPQEGSPGAVITRLPATYQDLKENYDAVLLIDPQPRDFEGEWGQWLKDFVGKEGGGLLYMTGPIHTGDFLLSPGMQGLSEMLPAQFGDLRELKLETLLSTNAQEMPLQVVLQNIDHPMMRLHASPEESRRLWEKLPGVFWSFPIREAKPSSQVLLEYTDATLRTRPVLISARYGAGSVVYFGFNGTWRWRRVGHDAEYFDRFWVQTVRYLVDARTQARKRRGEMETDKPTYEVGDRVAVTLQLRDATEHPVEMPAIDAKVKVGTETEDVVLQPVQGKPGSYATTIAAQKPGRHTFSLTLIEEVTGEPLVQPISYDVKIPSVEGNAVWLNRPLLADLAKSSGGKYLEINQLDKLADEIPVLSKTIDVQQRPIDMWNTSRMLILLIGLLGVEWGLRKYWKLL